MLLFVRRLKEIEISVSADSAYGLKTPIEKTIYRFKSDISPGVRIVENSSARSKAYFVNQVTITGMPEHASRPGITSIVLAFPF